MATTNLGTDYKELILGHLDRLPPFSPVLNQLLASLLRDTTSFAQLASLIERDTVLSGQILRLVNSALYGRQGSIISVRHAVSFLGTHKLRNYVLGLSISQMWSKVTTAPGWSTQRFNVHSLATALLADMLAARLPAAHPECAFTTGLLHDLGRFMIATATPDEYETIDRLHAQGQRSLQECEIAVIGVGHDVLSAAALARWRLPQPIHDAVNTHHSQSLPVTMPAPGRVLPLGAILLLANRLASATGYALNELDAQGALPPEHILAGTGLERELDTLLTEFQAEFGVLRGTL